MTKGLNAAFHKYGDDASGVRDSAFGVRRTNPRTPIFLCESRAPNPEPREIRQGNYEIRGLSTRGWGLAKWFLFGVLCSQTPLAQAQDSGALKLLYAAPVTAATCTSGTIQLTVSGAMPSNIVTGINVDVGGSSAGAWNGNGLGPITVSGQNISYSESCSGFSAYTGGGYVSAQIPYVGAYYVVDVPGHIRLALGDQSVNCGSNSCVYGMGLSDLWDNKNDTEFDIVNWTASGSSVTLTLSGSPSWTVGQPVFVFDSSLSSGTLTGSGAAQSINGGFIIGSISGNQITFTLTGGVSCTGTCSGAGGFVYQIDISSPNAGFAQMQFGLINAPYNLVATTGGGASVTGTSSGGDGKTVTLSLANSSMAPTVPPSSTVNVAVSGVTVDTGTCTFNTAGTGVTTTATGQIQYQLPTVQTNSCTGHGGTATAGRWGEYKNSSGAQIAILEANNVRVRFKETWGLRQYGQWASFFNMPNYTNGLDCCVTGTEYYTIYRPDKVFHRFDMSYTNGDSQGPLTFGNVAGGAGSDATTQVTILKTANFANNKAQADNSVCQSGGSYYAPISPPWQEVWQSYLRYYTNKTWQMVTPNRASWYGTTTLTNGSATVTAATGDNFAAGVPLASWVNASFFIWSTTGNGAGTAVQLTVSSVTGGDFTGGTTLTLSSTFSGASGTYNYYVGGLPAWDFGNVSNCSPALPAFGVLQPSAGDVQTCAAGAPSGSASGCQSPYNYGTKLSGVVHANFLRILGASPLASPALGNYIGTSLSGPTWFEGMRDRLQGAYQNVTLAGDGSPHTILYDTLRLGDDGLWAGSRQATQALAGDYAAEYEAPPAPNFTTGSCTSGYGANCFDQDTGAYQITASGGSVNFTLSLPSWQSNHTYSLGQAIWDGTNVEVATFVNAASGQSGGSQPNWSSACPSQGNICTDNNVVWTNPGSRYFHYPAFEVAGWNQVPSTLTVNSATYNLNADYVGAVNAGGVIIQLLTGDSGTAGFYASGLTVQGSQGSQGSQAVPNATVGGMVTVGGKTIVQ